MSAWKDDEEEVPPSKIALKVVNVLVSVICRWYVKIGCWGPRSMVVVCGIFLFYVACTSFWCFSKWKWCAGTSGLKMSKNIFLRFAITFCC